MRFGFCSSPDSSDVLKAQGWDYIEISASRDLADDEGQAHLAAAQRDSLPTLAANSLVRTLKITGPEADPAALTHYMTRAIDRAAASGVGVLVFGSAGARNVPDGFDRHAAERQIIDFLQRSGDLAATRNLTIAIEPLHRGEANILTGVKEAARFARAADSPAVRCLIDSFHHWKEQESLDDLAEAMPLIAHVHVADLANRAAPGQSGSSDYRPFFRTLKAGGYDGLCSVECAPFNLETRGEAALNFLRQEWDAA